MRRLHPTPVARAFVKTNTNDVDVIVLDARRAVETVIGKSLSHGQCIPLMFASILAASRRGILLVPQAGTASFYMRAPEWVDDGGITHFSYQWTGIPHGPLGIYEIHAWAGSTAKQEIVDLSTPWVPEACLDLAGQQWAAPTPPRYLWTPTSKLPENWHYEPNREATMHAMEVGQELLVDLRRAMPPITGPDSSLGLIRRGVRP